MHYLVSGHIRSLEMSAMKRTNGSKDWHHWFNFPSRGVQINVFDLGSPHLGIGASALFALDLGLDPHKRVHLNMGFGLGYIQKPFDAETNFQNPAIGSSYNAAVSLGIHTEISLPGRLLLKPGIGIHHFSNGAFKIPNSGINLALLKLILAYDAAPAKLPARQNPEFDKPAAAIYAGSSFGLKEALPVGSGKFVVVNIFGTWAKRVSRKTELGVEAGLNYNESLAHRITDRGPTTGKSADNFRAYIAGQYMLLLDPFAVRFQAGSYIAPAFKDDGLIFFRYHLVYQLEKFQVFAGLKSHFAKADNAEVGIAYKIR